MYCPNCGNQFSQGQRYCRTCGRNLTIFSKADKLSQLIKRRLNISFDGLAIKISDSKLNQLQKDISEELEKVSSSIHNAVSTKRLKKQQSSLSPARRRDKYLVDGFKALFGGIGMMIVLYIVGRAMDFNIPPRTAARFPFNLESLIRISWLFGLIPTLSGLGQIVASLFIRAPGSRSRQPDAAPAATISPPDEETAFAPSVTEYTTELLDSSPSAEARPRGAQSSE